MPWHGRCLLLWRVLVVALALLLTAFPAAVRAVDGEGAIRLLQEASASRFGPRGLLLQQRRFKIRSGALRAVARQKAGQLLLPVLGKETAFRMVSAKRNPNRTLTWTGRSRDRGIVLLTMGRDHFFARVVRAGRVTVFRPDGGFMVAEELDPAMAVSLQDDVVFPAASLPAGADSVGVETKALSAPVKVASESDRVIDVMVLYTPGMAAAYPGDAVRTRIQYLVDLANQALANSAIHVRFRLVHAEERDYPDSGSMETALTLLTNNETVFQGVETLRDLYGADQVTLLRRYVDAGCGMAWLMQQSNARYAYAVVHDGRRSDGYYCDDLAYVHEVGHNLGCSHDRANSNGNAGMYDYSYGYQFQAAGQWYRTIMSYDCPGGCTEISYFSNPAILYQGVPIGVAPGSPDAADNSDTINQTSYLVQDYRPATDPDLVASLSALTLSDPVTEVGSTAYTDPVLYIENHGIGYLQIGQVGRSLQPPFYLDSDSCSNHEISPASLNPAAPEHCSIRLRFEPKAPGVYSDELEIPSNDPDTPLLTLAVSGTAESTPPWITAIPSALSFGRVQAGSLDLRLVNRGRLALQIGAVSRSGRGSSPFSVLVDGCSGQILATDQGCSMRIGFTPADTALYRDSLLVPSNDPLHDPLSIPIRGGSFSWSLFLPAIRR